MPQVQEAEEYLQEFWRASARNKLTEDLIDQGRTLVLSDSPPGYRVFYETVRALPLPFHCYDWIEKAYEAEYGRFLLEAFRGSTKTTSITETLTAYQIGLHPERSNLFVQVNDTKATKHAANVAAIIELNELWKLWFPHVVPDKGTGWGAMGYWVADINYSDGAWQQRRHQDATLIGAGYTAGHIIGSHPTGVFVLDDINDDKNTESERENRRVNRVLQETLMPMVEKARFSIFCQTPWTRKDALAVAKNMGVYTCVKTPVLEPDEDGEQIVVEKDGMVIYEEKANLTWPERFDQDLISLKYKESGSRGFARMYLLDLSATEGQVLKREWLRHTGEIDPSWPVFMGVDYSSSADLLKNKDSADYTTVAIVRVAPNGNRYIEGGFRERLSQAEAEAKVQSFARTYPQLQMMGIEQDGRGSEFYTTMIRNTNLSIIPMPTKGRGKGYRFDKIMAPHFELGRVWITDLKTDFITSFEDEWLSWPNGDHDDCLDAVFWALAASGLFMETLSEPVEQVESWMEPKKKVGNPFNALGSN